MDAALLLIAANMDCPQPQTSEHLVALEIVKLDHIIILQNKVDIIFKDEERALENYKQIKDFIKSTRCENAPIIPISAQLRYNIDAVCQSLNNIPIPKRSLQVPPKMIIIRSFDVNKPGCKIDDLVGGVVGGSILEGVISIGMEIEIRPGQLWKDENGNIKCTPIRSRVVSLLAENNELLYAVPGGLIGVGLLVDPSITRNDKLVGSVLGAPGSLPDIFVEVDVKFYLMRKLLGVKNEGTSKQVKIQKLTEGETLKFNVGSTETPGQVVSIKEDIVKIKFTAPICTTIGEKVAFSRRIEKSFRLIGWGEIIVGKKLL